MAEIINIKNLINILKKNKLKKVALSHGVFDLLHHGHLRHFDEIKKKCDILIVSITSDKFVKKGNGRPFFKIKDRIYALSKLKNVNYIVESNNYSAVNIIKIIKPDLYCKGPDYKNLYADRSKKILAEKKTVEKYNGKIYFTSEITSSSSKLINSAFIFNDNQINFLKKIKKKFNIASLESFLNNIVNKKVTLIGESIIDQYTELSVLNKSGKDSILNYVRKNDNQYLGGILAVANNTSEFVNKLDLVSYIGSNKDYVNLINKNLKKNVNPIFVKKKGAPTIVKQRFIDQYANKKILGIYNLDDTYLDEFTEKFITENIKKIKKNSLVLLFDYGHGLFTPKIVSLLNRRKDLYKSLNCQLNSSSIGLHSIENYKNSFLITMNGSEIRHEMRNKSSSIKNLLHKFSKNISSRYFLVTMGNQGSILFDKLRNKTYECPGFASSVVDKTGAGDSMIPIISLGLQYGIDEEVALLLGSIYASETIKHNANKYILKKETLLDLFDTMLKV